MLRKHEDKKLNFFRHGHTSVKAEWFNGKIQCFTDSNFGLKDKDFFLYGIAGDFP
jgi:hypothetical protein